MRTNWLLCAATVLALGFTFGAEADPSISITPDVVYGHKDGMALTYDVVQPTSGANGAGILYMVSGGWFSRWNAPESVAPRFSNLTEKGYTIYFVRHGSAPRYKVPEAVADVKQAFDHIIENAEQFGVDPHRLGVFGGSAGGHLSLMLGCAVEEAESKNARIAAVVAYFPPVDLRAITGPNDRFPALDFDPALSASISPILHASADDPPILLIHGDADDLVPISASEIMYAALQEQGVTSEFITIEGAGHGFRGEHNEEASSALAAWFDTHLAE